MRVGGALVLAVIGVLQPQAPPAPPGTDIYLIPLSGGLASMNSAVPAAVAIDPGYDNQPAFSPDGRRILLTGNRDGKQMDTYVFDRAAKQLSQLTHTSEGEYSPTFLPSGIGEPGGFSVIRVEPDGAQRLWRFNAAGDRPELVLRDVKPVGYHAWVDADHLALFVLGQPATLRLARVSTGAAEIVASDVGRSLHRVPGSRLVSFIHKEPSGEYWVEQIDVDTKAITPLVRTAEGSSDRDCAWMPDGKTLLMSSGTKIMSWTQGAKGWTEVFDGAVHKLGAISRLAVSPSGDAVAIVTAEPKRD
jgi:dipeptidyl aminopeptidase/acylaminoacyl peptidase